MMDAETWMDGKEAVEAGFADECGEAIKVAACAVDVSKFAAKVDARVAAIMPKPEAAHVPETPPAPVAPPPAPVLLHATVVESRIESEKALAFQNGAASRDAEILALAAARDGFKAELTAAQDAIARHVAEIADLKKTVANEQQARVKAVTAHAALMGGAKLVPDETRSWPELVRDCGGGDVGYAKARRLYPEAWAIFMNVAPGSRKSGTT
jgi:hypothetical protein